jgi:hypothetical protein
MAGERDANESFFEKSLFLVEVGLEEEFIAIEIAHGCHPIGEEPLPMSKRTGTIHLKIGYSKYLLFLFGLTYTGVIDRRAIEQARTNI